jgi:ribosomal protein S18 acetylase RimI-like enzyme
MISIRNFKIADLAFADSLRKIEGWNQTSDDWFPFIALEPNGCFLAEWNGLRAGTITTIRYGENLAWIGMALVHPDFRRRGIGRSLLERAIEYLRANKVKCIKLDATPVGKQLYDSLGFIEEGSLTRWAKDGADFVCSQTENLDIQRISFLDEQSIGANRYALLSALASASFSKITSNGFGMIRAGSNAAYLGPVVTATAKEGLTIVRDLISDWKVVWDIPKVNRAATEWAETTGFTRQRTLTRMYLGEKIRPIAPETLYAIAGPEFG